MDACSACGASLFGQPWCGQCGVRAGDGRPADARPGVLARWTPPANTVAPVPRKVYSRWHAGPLSLPPAAKIALTAAVWLIAAWAMIFSGAIVSGIVLVCAAAWVTRETWKRRRIR